jgi:hypothetical protein
MAVVSADYTTVGTALRRCLGNGTSPSWRELQLMLDVVEHAANTLDSKGVAAVAALDVVIAAQMALWNTAKGADSSSTYTTALAALVAPRAAAIAAAAVSVTDFTANDSLDGRAG